MKKEPPMYVYFLIFATILTIIVLSVGCSPQKKIDKAVMIVMTDSSAFAKVTKEGFRLHPCIPAIGKEGKTVTITNIVADTAQIRSLQSALDSIMSKSNITMNIDSLKRAILSSLHPVVKYEKSFRVDTVPDIRAIELMQERLDASEHLLSNAEGQLTQEKINTNNAEKLSKNRLAIIISIISFIALIFGVGICFKFFTAKII